MEQCNGPFGERINFWSRCQEKRPVHNVLFVDFGAPVYKNALCRIQRHLLWSRIIYSWIFISLYQTQSNNMIHQYLIPSYYSSVSNVFSSVWVDPSKEGGDFPRGGASYCQVPSLWLDRDLLFSNQVSPDWPWPSSSGESRPSWLRADTSLACWMPLLKWLKISSISLSMLKVKVKVFRLCQWQESFGPK